MCGITGYIDYVERENKTTLLQSMVATLVHRGPDSGGAEVFTTKLNSTVALGHRRLSIIDLSASGQQPMHYDNLIITFNGEIYNYQELQKELQKEGYVFTSNSDTEVILKAYKAWGSKCVTKFIGMFAFAIYDVEKQKLFCARDRAGVKPFFYYHHNNVFLFSSELKAFHKHPAFTKELNLHAVGAFVQFGNVPSPHCIFKHCYKLKPGHVLHFDISANTLETECYWDVYDAYNQPKTNLSFKEALVKTEEVLSSAFNYRMVADVPVGVFLSGGYDSACLTALLQKDRSQKLSTFTIGVSDIGLNEAPYAREIAKYLGTHHTEINCTEKEVLELLEELPFFYDEPFADSSAIPTTLVCKMARRQLKVALSADGGDEIFAGYNRYDYLLRYRNLLNALPNFARSGLYSMMDAINARALPIVGKTYNFPNRYEKLKSLLRDPSDKNMMLSLSKQFYEGKHPSLVLHRNITMNTAYQSNELRKEYYTPLCYMMAIDYQTYLVDDILQKVDRASMSVSLEAREPFLDQRIIEFAATLPDDYKYHNGEKKYILKELVHKHIPKKLMDRPKMGFSIPIEHWLMTDLKSKVEHYLDGTLIKRQGLFDVEEIENLKQQFFAGKKEYGSKIWYLLMFQMWYERWM